jgi:hypothetical protein
MVSAGIGPAAKPALYTPLALPVISTGNRGNPQVLDAIIFYSTESQMNETKTAAPADALIARLRSSLSASGEQAFGHLVLYTSFGVVRGRIGLTFAQGLINKETAAAELARHEVIEINDVTVEHYSNHLANASFDRLYVRLSDVLGFALVGNLGQG